MTKIVGGSNGLMERRKFTKFAVISLIVAVFKWTEAYSQSNSVEIQWTLRRDLISDVTESIQFEGSIKPDISSEKDTRGLPLLYILAGIVSLPYLAEAILNIYREATTPGFVIRAGSGTLEIRNNPALPPNVMVIQNGSGVEVRRVYEIPSAASIVELIKAVLSIH